MKHLRFSAIIEIIGINPFVFMPDNILMELFEQAGKNKGAIRVRGTINKQPYLQTLVRYNGNWRLYINNKMLKNSPQRIGEKINITIEFNPEQRISQVHPKLAVALQNNTDAYLIFKQLRPSLQHEIIRYINGLKTESSIAKNVQRAINFLLGKERFIGRAHP